MRRRARSRARSAWTAEKLRMTPAPAAIQMKFWSWPLSATAGKRARHDTGARHRRDSRQGTTDRVPFAGIAGHNCRLRPDRDRTVQLYIQSDFLRIAPLWTRTFVAGIFICRFADVAVFLFAGADE